MEAVILYGRRPHPTIPASNLARARAWYAEKLGFATDQEEAAAILYRQVDDPEAEVAELRSRGVEFEEYDQPGLRTVEGIAITPVGKAAWFKDSEGNLLTITQIDRGH